MCTFHSLTGVGLHQLMLHPTHAVHAHRQREAEAAEERSIQEYMRKRREREAAEATRQANKREAQDRCRDVGHVWLGSVSRLTRRLRLQMM